MEIDTFLLSCRVIGRTTETALLSHVVDQARERGRRCLAGWFRATAKNAPAKDFYARHGFTCTDEAGDDRYWTLDLSSSTVHCPEWIRLNRATELSS